MTSSYSAGYEAQVYLMELSEDGRWRETIYCGAIQQGEPGLTPDPTPEGNEEDGVAVGTRRAVSAGDDAADSGHGTPCPYDTGRDREKQPPA